MRNTDDILFSMTWETERKVQKILEVSQKRMPRETESTREKSFSTLKTNSDTMKAPRKYRSTPRRCAHFNMDEIYGLIDAGSFDMDPGYENNSELFKNSEFENIKGVFGMTRMTQMLRVHFGKNPYCSKNKQKSGRKQECTSTRTPCYAWENSMVQKMQQGGMIKCQL